MRTALLEKITSSAEESGLKGESFDEVLILRTVLQIVLEELPRDSLESAECRLRHHGLVQSEADTEASSADVAPFTQKKLAAVADMDQAIQVLQAVRASVALGDLGAFASFWIEGGCEDGAPKIAQLREIMALRFLCREE